MQLTSIIRQARNGELKSLSSKDKTDEVIVDYLNMAITALYARFNLKTEELIVALDSDRSIYKIDGTDDAVTITADDGTSSVLTADGADNLLVMLSAYDEVGQVSINNNNNRLGVYTISYNSIQVPTTLTGTYLSLIYRAKNPDIVFTEGSSTDIPVYLPPQLLEPVLHYIGYRAHGSLDGNIQAENNTHLMRYEASCKRILNEGLLPSESLETDNCIKGFMV